MSEEKSEKEIRALEFLNELKQIDSLIDALNEDYEETFSRCLPKGRNYDTVGFTGSHDNKSQVEEISIQLSDLARQKNKLLKRYAKHKTEVYRVLNRMHTQEYIKFLLMHYGKRMSVEEIANKLHYSRQWVYNIKKMAVQEFAEYMEDTQFHA